MNFNNQLGHWRANSSLQRKGLAVIAIPLVPLIVLAVLVTGVAAREREAQASVARALIVKGDIATVFGLFADAETGVRGYLLTRNPVTLKIYEDATRQLPSHYAQLASLLQDPQQRAHLERVIELGRQRPLTSLIEYALQNSSQQLVPMDLLAESRRVMALLRQELTLMQQREDEVLAQRVAAAQDAQERVLTVTLGGVGFGVVASLLAAIAFTSGVARRVDALRSNAVRLAAGDELLALAESGDEVGQLGKALREASALLQRRDRELGERLRELEAARGEVNQFFTVSLDLLCIAGLDGRFRRVNPAWHAVLGWDSGHLESVPFVDFIHPEDVDATIAETASLAVGEETIGFENRYRCRDGSYRWLNWKAKADPSRGVIYAAARDVTEQKRAAEEQKQRVTELAALNQELEAFSYSVSHDLRAPLRHISGFAALLEQRAGASLDAQALRHLSTIKDAAGRMGRLIDDLLAFSRLGRAQLSKRDVDFTTLVDDVRKELQPEVDGRDVQWTIHSLPHVVGDPALLRLAVTNLVSNALKYSRTRPRTEIEIGANGHASGETVIFVRDNGVGFDMQYAHKLFGVFQRLHSAEEFDGTGIGLANVRRIVHRHGGSAWAEGVVDGGATFYFSLPAHKGTGCDDRAA